MLHYQDESGLKPRECYLLECITPTVKFGGLMLLVSVKGKVNATACKDIIDNCMPPTFQKSSSKALFCSSILSLSTQSVLYS